MIAQYVCGSVTAEMQSFFFLSEAWQKKYAFNFSTILSSTQLCLVIQAIYQIIVSHVVHIKHSAAWS